MTVNDSVAKTSQPSIPDCENLSTEILCPLCDYNLRGLTNPRCPECGYGFEWSDLTDPARRKHRYLFEHHPERNVRSFLRTAIGQILPWRFWRSLRPEQPSNPRRLIAYWIIATALGCLTPFVLLYAIALSEYAIFNSLQRTDLRKMFSSPANAREAQIVIAPYGSVQAYLDTEYPSLPRMTALRRAWTDYMGVQNAGTAKLLLAALVIWPWLTIAALMLLRASMRQARIRTIHVARCVLYSFDIGLWLAAYLALYLAPAALARLWHNSFIGRESQVRDFTLCAGVLMVLAILRLIFAFRQYLCFRHAATTIICTQIIIVLTILAVIRYTPGMWERFFQYLFA